MGYIDILGMGIEGTFIGKSGKEYKGEIFAKEDKRSRSYSEGAFIIDIKELRENNVISKNSIERLNEKEFLSNSLKGDYYMIIENQSKIGREISTYNDLMGE